MDLESRIRMIEKRNKKVEADKAWEISWTRKILVSVFTYLFISLVLFSLKIDRPWINAVIPTIGFLLSTLSLPFLKNYWVKHIYKN